MLSKIWLPPSPCPIQLLGLVLPTLGKVHIVNRCPHDKPMMTLDGLPPTCWLISVAIVVHATHIIRYLCYIVLSPAVPRVLFPNGTWVAPRRSLWRVDQIAYAWTSSRISASFSFIPSVVEMEPSVDGNNIGEVKITQETPRTKNSTASIYRIYIFIALGIRVP